jgi:signal recognition particle subunit SRP54
MMQRMAGAMGLGPRSGMPSAAEVEKMQAELARLDPKALEQLPKELREGLPKGGSLPGLGSPAPRLPGLPGLGGGMPRFPMPGFPGKKK